jgi:hypothetical protein
LLPEELVKYSLCVFLNRKAVHTLAVPIITTIPLIRADKLRKTLLHYNSFTTTYLRMLALKFQSVIYAHRSYSTRTREQSVDPIRTTSRSTQENTTRRKLYSNKEHTPSRSTICAFCVRLLQIKSVLCSSGRNEH